MQLDDEKSPRRPAGTLSLTIESQRWTWLAKPASLLDRSPATTLLGLSQGLGITSGSVPPRYRGIGLCDADGNTRRANEI